ncbi:MAG: alcohol dehydrogenase catalytic domain-containing protein [Candidatus Lokiarchaeota archaeon]
MLAAVYHKSKNGAGSIKLEEVKTPQITKSDQIKIKVEACGICGTDLKILEGKHPANDNIILGHEFVGTIIEIGANIKDLKIGDKVVVDPNEKCGWCINCRRGRGHLCEYLVEGTTFGIFQNGGFSEFCVIPRSAAYKLPTDIDLVVAALVEPLSCAIHCHNIADVKESDNVVVIGAGPMGLIILSILREHPIKRLISIEPNGWRKDKALEFGADYAIDPFQSNVKDLINQYTNGIGADVIIDAVGIKDTFEMAQTFWAPGARLICFGQDSQAIGAIKPNDLVRYQRKIMGSYISTPEDFLDAIEFISNDIINAKNLISHQIPLRKLLSDGFPIMQKGKSIKIIVIP